MIPCPSIGSLGLAVDEVAPDHSTLTKFKARLLERDKLEAVKDLLCQIVTLAHEPGIRFGHIQVMDSVRTVADVNPEKEKARRDSGDQPPRDPDARRG